jgi:hypothetical protein
MCSYLDITERISEHSLHSIRDTMFLIQTTGLTTESSWFDSWQTQDIPCFSRARTASNLTDTGRAFLETWQSDREADHSPPTSAEV